MSIVSLSLYHCLLSVPLLWTYLYSGYYLNKIQYQCFHCCWLHCYTYIDCIQLLIISYDSWLPPLGSYYCHIRILVAADYAIIIHWWLLLSSTSATVSYRPSVNHQSIPIILINPCQKWVNHQSITIISINPSQTWVNHQSITIINNYKLCQPFTMINHHLTILIHLSTTISPVNNQFTHEQITTKNTPQLSINQASIINPYHSPLVIHH